MNLITELIVPIVSVVGTLLGIMIALDQLTAASRLRRQAIFWRDMASQEHARPRDSDVSLSLQREALGKLVALNALPAKWLWMPLLLLVTTVAAAVMLGIRVGEIPASELSWMRLLEEDARDPGIFILVFLPPMAALGTAGFINPALLRKRVAKAYLDEEALDLDSINGGRSLVDNIGVFGSIQVFAFGLGLTSTAAAIGGFAGAASAPARISEWIVVVLFVGAVLTFTSGFSLFARVQDYAKEEWRHPRPLALGPPLHPGWRALLSKFRMTRYGR